MLASARVFSPRSRLYLSALCLSAWLILLFTGWTFAGATHLLLPAALLLFPWRSS